MCAKLFFLGINPIRIESLILICVLVFLLPFSVLAQEDLFFEFDPNELELVDGHPTELPPEVLEHSNFMYVFYLRATENLINRRMYTNPTIRHSFTPSLKGRSMNTINLNPTQTSVTKYYFVLTNDDDIGDYLESDHLLVSDYIINYNDTDLEFTNNHIGSYCLFLDQPHWTEIDDDHYIEHLYWYGISAPKPENFTLQYKDNNTTFLIDKATLNDTIYFGLSPNDSHDIEYKIEPDGTWEPLENVTWEPVDFYNYSVIDGDYYVLEDVNYSGKHVSFRAYCNPNGGIYSFLRSYGYLETPIDVYPKPTCDTVPTQYYCSSEEEVGLAELEIKNINSHDSIDSVRIVIQQEKDNPTPVFNTVSGLDTVIAIPRSSFTFNIDNPADFPEGSYRVQLTNILQSPADSQGEKHSYDCGHNMGINFEVQERHNLADVILDSSLIECPNPEGSSSSARVLNSSPSGVSKFYEIGDNEEKSFNWTNIDVFYPDSNATVSLHYSDGKACKASKDVKISYRYAPMVFSYEDPVLCHGDTQYDLIIEPDTLLEASIFTCVTSSPWDACTPNEEWNAGDTFQLNANKWQCLKVNYGEDGVCALSANKYVFCDKLEAPPSPTYETSINGTGNCAASTGGIIVVHELANVDKPVTINLIDSNEVVKRSEVYGYNDDHVLFQDLYMGEYQIEILTRNGCSYIENHEITYEHEDFRIEELIPAPVTCHGGADGSVEVITGGASPGSDNIYVSLDGENWVKSNTLQNLNAGKHTIYVRPHAYDECIVNQVFTIPTPEQPTLSVDSNTITLPTCPGAADGNIQLTLNNIAAEDQAADFTFQREIDIDDWVTNSQGNAFYGLAADTYTFRAISPDGCTSKTLDFTLNDPDPVSINAHEDSISHPGCHGDNGNITFSLSGGNGDYSYLFQCQTTELGRFGEAQSDSNTTVTKSLPHGSYVLLARDSHECDFEGFEFEIEQPEPVSFSYELPETNGYNIPCFGGSVGVNIDILGGTIDNSVGYTFSINGYTDTRKNFSESFEAGTYPFHAEDANQCNAWDTLVITHPPALEFSITENSVNPTCPGDNDGQVELEITGGIMPYKVFYNINTYTFSHEFTDSTSDNRYTLNGLGAGEYRVWVEDANECQMTDGDGFELEEIVNLTSSPPFVLDVAETTDPACYGYSDGSITVQAGGGVLSRERTLTLWQNNEVFEEVTINPGDSLLNLNPTFPDLPDGTYSLSISDGVCDSWIESIILNQPHRLEYSLLAENVSCHGDSNGKIAVQFTGGNRGYSATLDGVTLTGDQNTLWFEGLIAGDYSPINISDKNGCESSPDGPETITVLNPPRALDLTLHADSVQCHGEDNGILHATAIEGWGDFRYSMDGETWQGDSLFHRPAGSHTLFVKDDGGCIVSRSLQVPEPEVLAVDDVQIQHVSCNEGNDGTFTLLPSGGNGGYIFQYEDDEWLSQPTRDALAAGNYPFKVRDAKGCLTEGSVEVTQPQPFYVAFSRNDYNGYSIRCHGLADTLRLVPSGATAPYESWVDDEETGSYAGNDTIQLAGLTENSYHIRFTDANGCEYHFEDEPMTAPDPLAFNSITPNQPTCHEDEDGWYEAAVQGGPSALSYTLELTDNNSIATAKDVDASHRFQNLKSAEYRLSLTDANSCSIDTLLFLDQPRAVTLDSVISTPATCHGDSEGSILAGASGGGGDYHYLWKDSRDDVLPNSPLIEGLKSGTYTLELKDLHGCEASNPEDGSTVFAIEVAEPEPLNVSAINHEQPTCHGDHDGKIRLTSTGGWGSRHYFDITSPSRPEPGFITNPLFADLMAASYTLHVRDSLGCQSSSSFTLTQPDPLELRRQQVIHVNCGGENSGEVHLEARGGTRDYTFGVEGHPNGPDSSFTELVANEYQFWVKDARQCVDSLAALTIEEMPPLTYTVEKDQPDCALGNGQLTLVPQGGQAPYAIEWSSHELSDETLLFSGLQPGLYDFEIRDVAGCQTKTPPVILNTKTGPTVNIVDQTMPSCSYRSDGSLQVEVIPGGDATLQHLSWYNQPQPNDGELLSGISGGTYHVGATDSKGCHTTIETQLMTPDPITTTLSVSPVGCHGDADGNARLEVSGGTEPHHIRWFDEALVGQGNTLKGLAPGTYRVALSDAMGCGLEADHDTLAHTFDIDQPLLPLALGVEHAMPLCYGDSNASVVLDANNGWGNYRYGLAEGALQGSPVFDGLQAGLHQVKVVDREGCEIQSKVEIETPAPLLLTMQPTDHVSCFGMSDGSIHTSATGGTMPYTFNLENTDVLQNTHGVFQYLAPASYSLWVEDANNCITEVVQEQVEEPGELVAGIDYIHPAHCGTNDGYIRLHATGGTEPHSVQWEHTDLNTSMLAADLYEGRYTATISDQNQCQAYLSDLEVPGIEGPAIQSADITQPLCHDAANGAITLEYTGISSPFTHYINGQEITSSTADSLTRGEYLFVVQDMYGCADTMLVPLSAPDSLQIAFDPVIAPLCHGYSNGRIVAQGHGGTGPYAWAWENGSNEPVRENIPSGRYPLTLRDANHCIAMDTVFIHDPDPVTVSLPEDIILCQGQNASLDAGNPGLEYWWETPYGEDFHEQILEANRPGQYVVQVTDHDGCFARDSVTISTRDYEVNATLLLPSNAQVGDTIVAVDISWPISDTLIWHIPQELLMLEDNQYEKHLVATGEGVYTLGLTGITGECLAYNSKTITVAGYAREPVLEKSSRGIFNNVNLWPNPASNETYLKVVLNDEADISVLLLNNYSLQLYQAGYNGNDRYDITVPLHNLPKGVYIIRIMARGQVVARKVVVH